MRNIEGRFKGQKGLGLYYQGRLPAGDVKAVLIVVHGVAEHSGRYLRMAEYLASKGFATYGLDLRGHGQSEGKPGFVEHFSYYVDDVQAFMDLVAARHPGKKIFLFGHSMGAAISLTLLIDHPQGPAGLVISGASMKYVPHFQTPLAFLLKPFGAVAPKLGMYRMKSAALSRDRAIIESYDSDPLVYRGKLSVRLISELIWSIHKLNGLMGRVQVPVLIIHGSADRLSYPAGAQMVYDRVGSKDKTLIIYPGFYHEILNEPGFPQVLSDMEHWLERLSQSMRI